MENQKLTGYPSIDKPWLKYYSEEALNSPLPECTMYEYVYNANQNNLNKIALNYYGTEITYGALFYNISKVACALENIGVKKGDIVTVCMINSPEAIYLLFALNKIGAIANMIYGTSTEKEIIHCLHNTNSSIVFSLDIFADKFSKIKSYVKINSVIVVTSGFIDVNMNFEGSIYSWSDFIENAQESETYVKNPHDAAVITYTGGTTGGSKGVVQSNYGIISNVWQNMNTGITSDSDAQWLHVIPLFTSYGIHSLIMALRLGMKLIIRTPMSDNLADLLENFNLTHVMYGPAWWEGLAASDKKIDLSRLYFPMAGGDTLKPHVEILINEYLLKNGSTNRIMNGYGMTEAGPGVSHNSKDAYMLGSVGVPFPKTIVSVFDPDTGKELKYGERGELCIHTPSMMKGYINNQAETDKIIKKHDDGLLWVHSGDLGYMDEDGFIYISGRLKRYMLCAVNGIYIKVFSLDIEKALDKHEYIKKSVVVPKNDGEREQVPVAFIVLKDNIERTADTINTIKKYAEELLDDGYHPAEYFFVDDFPLTKVGKVDYKTLEQNANE